MSEYKCHKIKRNRVPNDERCLFKATDKPIPMIIILWAVFIFVLCTFEKKLLSLPVLLYCLFISFRKEEIPFAGYETFFVVYNRDYHDECDLYYINDIKQWQYVSQPFNDKIMLDLVDGEQVIIDTEVDFDIYLYFKKMMNGKEKNKEKKVK